MPRNSFVGSVARALTASSATAPGRKTLSPKMTNSLMGSARVDKLTSQTDGNSSAGAPAVSRAWQQQAWQFYEEVGELHYTMNFIGACLSRCILTIGLPDDDGHIGPAFDEDDVPAEGADGAVEALRLVRALKSDIGGQPQLLRSLGINIGMAGECHLVGQPYDPNVTELDNVEALQWEVLSTDEFRRNGESYERRPMPGSTPIQIDPERVHAVRIWRSHPRWSELPDSSVRAVRDILEELVLLTRQVRGEALSRLSNAGILLVPQEIEYPDDAADDEEAGDPFTRDLIETFATAISDKGSAAQTVPFVVRAAAEYLKPEYFRKIDLSPSDSGDTAAKRAEAVQRFAQGMDLPVEIVTGHANTTFANAVQIDDSTFKAHIEPILETVCDALTAGFLRPALESMGLGDSSVVVYYDSSELVSRPNKSQDAKDLHDRFAISDSSLRSSAGFAESDAPDEEELAKRIELKQAIQTRTSVPQTPTGEAQLDESIGRPAGMPDMPGAPIPQGEEAALVAGIEMATEVSIERAVRRAGARLRSKAAKRPDIRDLLAQVPDAEVPVTLGPTLISQMTQGDDLFLGEFDTLRTLATRWTGSPEYAEELKAACVLIATERLYQPRRPFPFSLLPRFAASAVA